MSTEKLPIPATVGKNPFFKLEKLLNRENETGRVDCSFDAIQDYVQRHTKHHIPSKLSESLARMGRWQLVYPNTFDLSQVLLIGKSAFERGYIPLAEAEATIYFHRGVEEWKSGYPVGPYTPPWKMELAGIYPDSNGNPRLLSAYYRLHTWEADYSLQDIRVSILDAELVDREKESDSVWGPVLTIEKEYPHPHPFIQYGFLGVLTPGMFRLIPGQRRLVVISRFHDLTEAFDNMLPKKNHDLSRSRGICGTTSEDLWHVGLNQEGTSTPWTLSIPLSLEEPNMQIIGS